MCLQFPFHQGRGVGGSFPSIPFPTKRKMMRRRKRRLERMFLPFPLPQGRRGGGPLPPPFPSAGGGRGGGGGSFPSFPSLRRMMMRLLPCPLPQEEDGEKKEDTPVISFPQEEKGGGSLPFPVPQERGGCSFASLSIIVRRKMMRLTPFIFPQEG